MKFIGLFVGILILTISVTFGGSGQEAHMETGFRVGQVFPDIVLPSLEDGRPRSMSEFRGQKVILHVFASW